MISSRRTSAISTAWPISVRRAFLAEQQQVRQRRHHAGGAARRFQREHAGVIFARVIQIGHRLALSRAIRPKIGPVADKKQRRNVRRKARFVKVDAQRIGQPQMPDAADGGGQRPHRPAAKAERIFGES